MHSITFCASNCRVHACFNGCYLAQYYWKSMKIYEHNICLLYIKFRRPHAKFDRIANIWKHACARAGQFPIIIIIMLTFRSSVPLAVDFADKCSSAFSNCRWSISCLRTINLERKGGRREREERREEGEEREGGRVIRHHASSFQVTLFVWNFIKFV